MLILAPAAALALLPIQDPADGAAPVPASRPVIQIEDVTRFFQVYDAAGHVTTSAAVTVTRVKTLTATIAVVRTTTLSKAAMSKKRPGRRLERHNHRLVRR